MPTTQTKLIPLKAIPRERPDWPWSPWATGELIRKGRLGCIRCGKRIFVTDELLSAFVEKHTVAP
jgi:hypothetical protein